MVNNKTLSEQTYLELSKMILNNKFSPGEKITEEYVATLLGVSRTTVKKAFTTLVMEGILEDIPRKGVFIKTYSNEEVLEIYDLREVVAGLSARYASMNVNMKDINYLESLYQKMETALSKNPFDFAEYSQCDIELHEAIIKFSGSKIVSEIITSFNLRIKPFNVAGVRDPNETIIEHRNIIDALKSGNPETAEFTMREHIKKAKNFL